ncbi:methyl-accepting chemotaxis protein [Thiopseudomonas alkaliphila]|uniref:Methyl-accepting chemotaxis protein n=1 Tax=Thiopseudomonas alkaliphila TaxID=1697053 RepID=A0AAW7DRK9_9GAMM|nr:methyl-accepting chemotaxis protein [Thiopseudomonas alkaliphila]
MNSSSTDTLPKPVSKSLLISLILLLGIGLVALFGNAHFASIQIKKEQLLWQQNMELHKYTLALEKAIKDAADGNLEAFPRIEQARSQLNTRLTVLKNNYPHAPELSTVLTSWAQLQNHAEAVLKNQNAMYEPAVQQAVKLTASNTQLLTQQADNLYQQLLTETLDATTFKYIHYALAAFLLLITILLIIQVLRLFTQLEQGVASEPMIAEARNQEAILRLLDEIGGLADGDLTAQATVTEDFTGAIADSINYAIDQLRGLVGTINTVAVQVSTAAQETQATAMHLAEASDHQAQEIAGATAAINDMAQSIDQVSADAAESAKVAEQSVATANKGNQLVHNTINGMDNIREQIQDTSKRIKRLGESSQEIGDIVDLINDIADQTNILALNAAIQASTAGDAGRGFAIVADEVQRLAERSSAATKQIETLVKTIQTDTNEAVASMEQTTTEVVRGARLAQDAGVSLEEIETVSKDLAALIQNISNTARQQASSAGHISNTMSVIQEITSQTSSGTTTTALNIGELAKMAVEMRNSISGFTLPNMQKK